MAKSREVDLNHRPPGYGPASFLAALSRKVLQAVRWPPGIYCIGGCDNIGTPGFEPAARFYGSRFLPSGKMFRQCPPGMDGLTGISTWMRKMGPAALRLRLPVYRLAHFIGTLGDILNFFQKISVCASSRSHLYTGSGALGKSGSSGQPPSHRLTRRCNTDGT